MLKPLLTALSPAGPRARLQTLIFHRVLPAPDPLFLGEPDAERFDAICRWVRRSHHVLPLTDAVTRLRNGTLPARALAITFDDGYADNHSVALPILQRHGLTATFFVASGFLDGGCMWNDVVIESVRHCKGDVLDVSGLGIDGIDRIPVQSLPHKRHAIGQLLRAMKYLPMQRRHDWAAHIAAAAGIEPPRTLMMTSGQVAQLAKHGMQVGGHTVSHPILATLSNADAMAEISHGRQRLQAITQTAVDMFAYPNGQPSTDYSVRDVALAEQAGFSAAVATAWGCAGAASDMYQLPRFTPWDRSRWRFGLRLALNTRQPVRVCPRAATPPLAAAPAA